MTLHSPRAPMLVAAVAAALTLTGCLVRPPAAPAVEDSEPPTVTLTANGQNFRSDEEPSLVGHCVEAQRFPATVAVAASDIGGSGVARVVIQSFPGELSSPSVAPDSATTRLTPRARGGSVLEVTANPPAGQVQPNLLISFAVSGVDGLQVRALDSEGNDTTLPQVDVREAGDIAVCRGEE